MSAEEVKECFAASNYYVELPQKNNFLFYRQDGDTATEARIRQAFRNELKGATKILIAQRVTSVMEADKIVVMHDGAVSDVGTHAELLARSPEYQEIYYSQMEKEAN